jgi:hypothetical protein
MDTRRPEVAVVALLAFVAFVAGSALNNGSSMAAPQHSFRQHSFERHFDETTRKWDKRYKRNGKFTLQL